MASAPTVAVGFTFQDRDGNRAKATSYCPIGFPVEDVWDFANDIASKMQALSNGLLVKIDLSWRYTIDDLADPSIDSTNERKLLLLMNNDAGDINGMIIASPGAIFETTGAYAGIRLDLAGAGAIGWVDMLATMDLRTDDNRALGTELITGGLAL